MPKLTMFDPYNADEQTLLLGKHMPNGKIWSNKLNVTSNLGKFIRALGIEYYRFQILTGKFLNILDIRKADEEIIEWEKSVGLPDSCFPKTEDIEERKRNVELKLSRFGGVQTEDDYKRVAAIFGFNITVSKELPTEDVLFPLKFPINFQDRKGLSNTIYITITNGGIEEDKNFPLPFPIPFSKGGVTFLKCIFPLFIPITTKLIVEEA